MDSTDFCHELENYSMDLKRLHRSLTLIYFVLLKATDFYPEQWVPEPQFCVALGPWMKEGRARDVAYDRSCILSSPTFGRIHHTEVAIAWLFSGFSPDSWYCKLHGSLFPSVPSSARKYRHSRMRQPDGYLQPLDAI